jgi:hypothetical protein
MSETQGTLVDIFNRAAAEEARDKALAAVERGAPEEWVTAALVAIRRVAATRKFFTTDDVWASLADAPTVERRALGALMRQACDRHWIEPTDRYEPSARVACHRRPVRIWCSLLWRE